MIDRTTRWPEAAPIPDTSADTVTNAFSNTWITRFGAPSIITTDRETQFESLMFEAMVRLIESQRTRTTAYHPQANGMMEQWHRSPKAAIMCHGTKGWTNVLPISGTSE